DSATRLDCYAPFGGRALVIAAAGLRSSDANQNTIARAVDIPQTKSRSERTAAFGAIASWTAPEQRRGRDGDRSTRDACRCAGRRGDEVRPRREPHGVVLGGRRERRAPAASARRAKLGHHRRILM